MKLLKIAQSNVKAHRNLLQYIFIIILASVGIFLTIRRWYDYDLYSFPLEYENEIIITNRILIEGHSHPYIGIHKHEFRDSLYFITPINNPLVKEKFLFKKDTLPRRLVENDNDFIKINNIYFYLLE